MRRKKWRLPEPVLWPIVYLFAYAMNAWFATLSLRVRRYSPDADPGDDAHTGPAIYVFWHEYLLLPIYLRPHCGLTMLTSQHRDAEMVTRLGKLIGMDAIRGSTNRGAIKALRKLCAESDSRSLAIVPDGPKGPRRQLAQGCVYLSSRMQIPIVLIGIGYDRPWRFQRAWDKFALPRPFSRARIILSPRIQVPLDVDRDGLEQHRLWMQQLLQELTTLAEEWAENRCTVPGSEKLYRHRARHLKNAPQHLPVYSLTRHRPATGASR